MANEALISKTHLNLFGAWWSAIMYCALLFVGWFAVAGFFPPHSPSAGAEQIAAIFREHATRIRIGMVIAMWGCAFFITWTASVADYVSRIEGRNGPLTRVVTMGGYTNALFTFYPPLWWIINSFRPAERTADTIFLLNDVAWIQFLGAISLVMPMFAAIAYVAFNDNSQDPVFPRWFGYLTAWAFVLIVPDQALFFFQHGPFAWDGLFPFWIPVPVFCGWVLLTGWLVQRKARREAAQLQGT